MTTLAFTHLPAVTLTCEATHGPKGRITRKPRYLVTKTIWSLTADSPTLAQTRAVDLGEMIETIEWDMTVENGHTFVSDIKAERDEHGGVWAYREHFKVNRIDGGLVSEREMARLMVIAGC